MLLLIAFFFSTQCHPGLVVAIAPKGVEYKVFGRR